MDNGSHTSIIDLTLLEWVAISEGKKKQEIIVSVTVSVIAGIELVVCIVLGLTVRNMPFFKDNIIRLLGFRFLGFPALGTNNWVSGLTVLAIFLGLWFEVLGFLPLGVCFVSF